ncbi:MAG: SanA/YdcF family protein [Verrucomicrobiota bacterium JB025]|nr:ElyC/SanA/YdcF family protein [Verrucomicrobiota bacterium JB025]
MAQVTHNRRRTSKSPARLLGKSPWLRRALAVATLGIITMVAVIAYANITAFWASRGRIFTEVSQLPTTPVGLVFGTTHQVDGRENLYFRYRIDAAAEIFHAGKVRTLIVSGDNRTPYYNEPARMREALIERGVPPDRIVRDFAGRRTLDSVVRAKEIFGVTDILFISQRFQNERAIYLAKAHGISAIGFNTRDVENAAGFKTKLREVGARVKMWLDVNFLHTRPQVLGDPEPLPE